MAVGAVGFAFADSLPTPHGTSVVGFAFTDGGVTYAVSNIGFGTTDRVGVNYAVDVIGSGVTDYPYLSYSVSYVGFGTTAGTELPGNGPVGLQSIPGRSYPTVGTTFQTRLAHLQGLSLTTEGVFSIYTMPDGVNQQVALVVIRCVSADTVTAPPVVSVGTNAEANNLVAEQVLYGLDASSKAFGCPAVGSVAVMQGDTISIKVVSAAAAVGLIVDVDLLGVDF